MASGYLSHIMTKPAFCICENKGADQLCGNPEANQCLCFLLIDSTIPLLSKFNIYAPNFEKVGSILLSACPSVRASVRSKNFKARVLKFHIWIPRQKIAYPYFFSCLNYLPLPSYAPLKG